MSLHTVQEIERAIGSLTQQEQEEIGEWLEAQPQPLDARIAVDLGAGRLDTAIQQPLSDEKQGNVRSL